VNAARLAEQNVYLLETIAQRERADTRLAKVNESLRAEVRERRQAQAELQAAKEAAERASRAKSQFLANMSHELRTPLNHIIGFSDLVASGELGDLNLEQREYMNDVLGSGRHLLAIINDLLDLSRIESGRTELEVTDVDLGRLCAASVGFVEDMAAEKQLRIATRCKELSGPIRADERRLRQVLINLLANAVKYTPEGGAVELSARCRADQPDWVEVAVRDTGIGLDSADLERIFDDFEQVEGAVDRRFGGTGLGLALTRRLVELHRGRIWAESAGPGRGSTFRFCIPQSYSCEE
jgi:signal transduction histidine kinase